MAATSRTGRGSADRRSATEGRPSWRSAAASALRGKAGEIASSRKLRLVPSLPAIARRRFKSPATAWPAWTREVPTSLSSYPGTQIDQAAVDQAFAQEPLQDFLTINARAMIWLRGYMWQAMLPVSPRYWRARIRSAESGGEPAREPTTTDPVELTAAVKRRAVELGISSVGVAAYDERFMFEQWHGTEVGDRLVVCVLEQAWGPTQQIPSARSEQTALSTYSEAIPMVCDLAEYLQGLGYRAEAHDAAGRGMAIHFAVEAGLGQLGLNGQLLTPYAGSRCRIIMLSTNAPLVLDQPRDFGIPKLCDSCQVCVKRCPPGAIPANRRVKRGVLKAPINTKRCFPVVGQAHGCAVCMKVCPVQRYGLEAVLDEYEKTGTVLGKGTEELESYHWPVDGKTYGPGEKPRVFVELIRPRDLPPLALGRADVTRQATAEELEQSRTWS